MRRALAPETFVTPVTPVGQYAAVVVQTGLRNDPPEAYAPEVAFQHEGVTWVKPMVVSNRGHLDVAATRPDATAELFIRHRGVVVDARDFVPVIARSGTLSGQIPTAIRFLPSGPIGPDPLTIHLRDLNNVYSDDRIEDGDLLLLEVGATGKEPDRYLFRALRFGIHTRGAVAVLVRTRIPGVELPPERLGTAITASVAVGYRFRPQTPFATFVSEKVALIGSVGVGSTAFEPESGGASFETVVDGLLIGGGIEGWRIFNVQVLGNLSSVFDPEARPNWTLAAGVDAVQVARWASHIDLRLIAEQPMHEERR